MKKLQNLVALVDSAVEKQRLDEPMRSHLGPSSLSDVCDRRIFYSFRWFMRQTFNGRILRLFDRGKREEPAIISFLEGAGLKILPTDPKTGRQWLHSGLGGHFGASVDGIISPGGPEMPTGGGVLEIKTHNTAHFAGLSKGVAVGKPEHYAQMVAYMGLFEYEWALYVAVNKNDDNLHLEIVDFNKELFDKLIDRAVRMIDRTTPPPRVSSHPSWYICRMCDYRRICHGGDLPDKNCRTCVRSRTLRPITFIKDSDGSYTTTLVDELTLADTVIEPHKWEEATGDKIDNWHCDHYNTTIPRDFLPRGCSMWEPIR